MLRKTLLVTTALVVGASGAYAGHKTFNINNSRAAQKMMAIGHPGSLNKGFGAAVVTNKRGANPVHNVTPHMFSPVFSNFSKAANAQFVSWFGYRAEASSGCWSYSVYHSCFQITGDNALSFTSGVTKTTKQATVAMFSFYPSAQYAVNLYSDAGGLPGAVIKQSHTFSDSDTALCCTSARAVTLKAPVTAGTKYWLGVVGVSNPSNGGWNFENTDFSGASVDYFHVREHYTITNGTTGSFSSPWHASTFYPATGAAMLK